MAERTIARITDLGWRDRAVVVALQTIVGVALPTSRDLRNRMLNHIVDGAQSEGVDYRPLFSVVLQFVSNENRRRLNDRVEMVLEKRGNKDG